MFVTDPNQPTGCNETTQHTIVFSNGYRSGINVEDSVTDHILELVKGTEFFNSPIPKKGMFFVYDAKKKDVIMTSVEYTYDKKTNNITFVNIPERSE